ncbi:hypothetical protein PVAP13_2KG304700 [Panicum virgatum]|uniref:Uncharacterized protein n=1 Tax=Panicum virgatum TaxID=38727 RepID=A0A8T0WDM9_PANVG|nr:hypothetical protein PVAP13_2KG304700 [Panicum virgatum]
MIALSHRSTMADPPMYAQRDRTAPSSIFVSATALPLLILRLRRLPCAPPSLRLPHAVPSSPSARPSPPPTNPRRDLDRRHAAASGRRHHLHARVWSACRNSSASPNFSVVAPSRAPPLPPLRQRLEHLPQLQCLPYGPALPRGLRPPPTLAPPPQTSDSATDGASPLRRRLHACVQIPHSGSSPTAWVKTPSPPICFVGSIMMLQSKRGCKGIF